MPQSIFIQFAGHCRIITHSQQVIDCILILSAAQSIMRHWRTCCHAHCSAFAELCIQVRHERSDFILSRLRLRLGRHLAAVDLVDRLRPVMRIGTQSEIARQQVNANVAFHFF